MLALVATGLPAILPMPGAAGEFCSTGVAGTTISCEALNLAQDLARRRNDRTLAADPARDRLRRLDASPATDGVTPFAMSGDDNNLDFRTSLTQWGSALSTAELESLKEAQPLIGDASLPKAVKPRAPKFDLWAQGRRERFNESGVKQGDALTTFIGADYRWDRDLLIGALIQLDDSRQTILAAPEATFGTAYMAGPYLAYRLTPHVTFDAKTAWGMAHDSAAAGSESMKLANDRTLSEARLTGNWGWKSWQISQTGALTYLGESGPAPMLAPGSATGVTRFSIGPELKHHIDTGNGASIEPFAFLRSSLDLAESQWAAPVGQNTVGGGILLSKPENFNIRATADYTESTTGVTDPVATGKVQVNLPASLLGF